MATDVGVGDSEVPFLDVTPAAEDTEATLTVFPPAESATASGADVPVTGGDVEGSGDDATQRWTADEPLTYDVAGRWVLRWEVTGTGEGAEDHEVYVVASPVAGLASWVPGRSRVANYVPGRTLVPVAGANTSEFTFTSQTRPTGIQTDRLIADAVAWVLSRTGPVHSSLHEMAASTASIRAAGMVELGYPEREAATKQVSSNTAEVLLAQAQAMRDDLVVANTSAGEPPVDAASALLPLYAFPRPPRWADLDL